MPSCSTKPFQHSEEIESDHADIRIISYPGDFLELRAGLKRAGLEHSGLGLDLEAALMTRFVHSIRFPGAFLEDPRLRGPLIFLANHEVAIETPVAMGIIFSILNRRIATISKMEHQQSFVGILDRAITDHQSADPNRNRIYYFDRNKPRDLYRITRDIFRSDKHISLLVHSEGTRALQAGSPTQIVGGVFPQLSMRKRIPIVPLRIHGGLPRQAICKHDFPYRFGAQAYEFGSAILPEELDACEDPRELILERMNAVGPGLDREAPLQQEGRLGADRLLERRDVGGYSGVGAVFCELFAGLPDLSEETQQLLQMMQAAEFQQEVKEGNFFTMFARMAQGAAHGR